MNRPDTAHPWIEPAITPSALDGLLALPNGQVWGHLTRLITCLPDDPFTTSRLLHGEFAGHRSIDALFKKWRVIYSVEAGRVTVLAVVQAGPPSLPRPRLEAKPDARDIVLRWIEDVLSSPAVATSNEESSPPEHRET
ncbi:MAG: hypothetical protein M5U22_07875 [Thermoleophilia bacterium]|nr:hypothetical protein [Thermoleophilia bacterium]